MELIERAFRDGIKYATICDVTDIDEAWRTSAVRADMLAAIPPPDAGKIEPVASDLVERLERFGIDDVDLDMLQRGDMLGSKAGAKFYAAIASLEREVAGLLSGDGFVYFNEDSGCEYSVNHPIESGECPDASDIRRSTPQEDHLNAALQSEFTRATAAEAREASLREALEKIVNCHDRNWQHQREKLDDCVPMAREALARSLTGGER